MTKKTIFPISRVHEPLRLDIEITDHQISDARISSTLFRGWELMLNGRDPRDAALFTQRICGICSSAHAVSASLAVQQALQLTPPPNGQLLTNLIFAADIIQNHLRHFYVLAIYDYVKAPATLLLPPAHHTDYRLSAADNALLLQHAHEAVHMAMRAHEMLAVFGAKAPHPQTILPGGVTSPLSAAEINAYRAILQEITHWVERTYAADIHLIAAYYPEYYELGQSYQNYLSYGLFPEPYAAARAFPAGLITEGRTDTFLIDVITEDVTYSWYQNDTNIAPPTAGQTNPAYDKDDAYSWIKAPRYDGRPYEGGPLARAWLSGQYRRGHGVLDRLLARALETEAICHLAAKWLAQLIPGAPTFSPYSIPQSGQGAGLTDAMRGGLGHWLSIENGRISHYQIITPTAWNFSPRDSLLQPGPAEQALRGLPIADPENPLEAGRVIRSFDPCFSCAVHSVKAPHS